MDNKFGKLNEDQAEIIQDTLYSSRFMSNMVDNILSTYRYDNGNISLKKECFDINSIITTCCNEQKYIINDKKLDVITKFDKKIITVYADVLEIKRVIMNLLSNAISYTPHNGEITIKSCIENDNIKISFIDNGKGISKNDIPNIFDKYTSNAKKFKQVGNWAWFISYKTNYYPA